MERIALDALDFRDRAGHGVDALNAWLSSRGIHSALEPDAPVQELLDAVRQVLAAAARGGQPAPAALDLVNAASAGAPTAPQLHWPRESGPRVWETTPAPSGEFVLGLIARSAIDLATLGGRERLRACEASPCQRLFVSSNPRRRWCSETCGNRARVARHAARQKARDSGSGRPDSVPGAAAGPL
jgi:predicted RNA-binding Zn ribbon-like protein